MNSSIATNMKAVVLFWMLVLHTALGGLTLHRGLDEDAVIADLVHTSYVDFGIQSFSGIQNTTYLPIRLLTQFEMDKLCAAMRNTTELEKIRGKYKGTILLILQDIRASCSPIDARLSYVNDVCYFGGINIQVSWFLKLYSNLRPADKFRGLSFVDNCTRLTIASDPNPNIVRSIRENNLTASLVVDTNPYIAYFETPQFRITYNYILGGIYFALAFYGALIFCWRTYKCTITRIFTVILSASTVTCSFLGVVQVYGAHFTDNELPMQYVLVGHNLFFGTSVATAALLVILYEELVNDIFKQIPSRLQKIQARWSLWVLALSLTFSDWLVSGLSFGVFTESVLLILRSLCFFVSLLSQVYVTMKLYKSSRKVIRFLSKNSINGVKSRLEKHFTFWLKSSVLAAGINAAALVLIQLYVPLLSPEAFAICAYTLTLGKQLNVLAQLQLCAPVKEKKSYTVTATNVSSAGYISFAPNKT